MRNIRLIAFIVFAAFIMSFMGICGEHEASHSDGEGHHCMAACGVGCCKSMIENSQVPVAPSFSVSTLFVPTQNFHPDIIVHSIKHPPKVLA